MLSLSLFGLLCSLSALLLLLVGGWVVAVLVLNQRHPEPHWDWDRINLQALSFPVGFAWGVAAAAHQVEGGNENNTWSDWERQRDGRGRPRIREGHVAGLACDHWNRYEEDIRLMKDLGVDSYRLSVEWSRLEPREGEWDEAAFAHYGRILDACLREGVEPMVTLLHFTLPLWFQARGGFEREENIPLFVRFSEEVFRRFGDRVTLWCTINEPEVTSLGGYVLCMFPPGTRSLRLAAQNMRNLVLAHARVVRAIHALPGGDRARVGLVKNIFQFDPYHRASLPDWGLARLAERAYNGAIMDYLRTGTFSLKVPGLCWYERTDPEVVRAGDFIGLNYYSHMTVCVLAATTGIPFRPRPGDVMTDMPYASYAEGFHRALQEIATLGLPVYVTENGIADARDDRRASFIRRYLYALSRAIRDGVDVRGYYYWSLMDNFEWSEGWTMKFGLYAMDPADRVRTLREGSRAFIGIVRDSRARVA